MNLQSKIAITMLLPLGGLLALVGNQDLELTRRRALEEGSVRLRDAAVNAGNLFDGQFRRIAQVADTAAVALQDSGDWTPEEILQFSRAVVTADPLIAGFGSIWEAGVVPGTETWFMPFALRLDVGLVESDLAARSDQAHAMRTFFEQVSEAGRTTWSSPVAVVGNEGGGREIVRYGVPVITDGEIRGVVVVDIGAMAFRDIAASIGLEGGPWLLMDAEGRGIAGQVDAAVRLVGRDSIGGVPLADLFTLSAGGDVEELLSSVERGATAVATVDPSPDSDELAAIGRRVVAITRIRSTGWLLVMGEPVEAIVDPAEAQVRDRAIKAGLVVLAALGVVIIGGWWTLLRPIRRLVDTVQRAAGGDVEARAGLRGRDELSVLGRTIDDAIPRLEELAATRASLENARVVQEALLPRAPLHEGRARIAGRVRPSEETGGDYFDHAVLEDGRIGFCLGDATGHGMPSALFVTTARAYVRAMLHHEHDLDVAIGEANRLLRPDAHAGLFMVLFMATWDPRSSNLLLASAGHPGWLLRCDAEAYELLEASGVPLGIDESARFDRRSVPDVGGGDLVLMASDGAWEVRNPDGDQLGVEALLRHARSLRDLDPEEQVRELFEFVDRFADGRPLDDDCTIVVARFD